MRDHKNIAALRRVDEGNRGVKQPKRKIFAMKKKGGGGKRGTDTLTRKHMPMFLGTTKTPCKEKEIGS